MIHNYTPHGINIVKENDARFDPSIRKFVADASATALMTIPSQGMLSAKMDREYIGMVDGCPMYRKVYRDVDPIPESVGNDDLVVVSALYMAAYQAVNGSVDPRLVTIMDPVYDSSDTRRIIGSIGIGNCEK
jgi:hypothetical protein